LTNKWVFNSTNLGFKHPSKLINDYLIFHNKLVFNIYLNALYIVKCQ